jgi:hypothetical protein
MDVTNFQSHFEKPQQQLSQIEYSKLQKQLPLYDFYRVKRSTGIASPVPVT